MAPGAVPGTVLSVSADGVVVACGMGALQLRILQPAGGKRMPAAAFAAGRLVAPGTCFAAAAGRDTQGT